MPIHVRHRPQDSVLYAVVRDHLGDFLREAREHGELPRFIEKTFRAYLDCGIPEKGCIRLHCDGCGHDAIVAFSCKKRGVCPSCSARAMGDGAAHLVDHVLPAVPYRQLVVSIPFALNGPLAFQPDLLRATERIITSAMCTWQQKRTGAKSGGVLVRHRFGGSLNLHVHGHALILDGGYTKDDEGKMAFHRAPPVKAAELEQLATTIRRRLNTLLKRRGLLRDHDGVNNEQLQLDALRACGQVALTTTRREKAGPALAIADENEVERPSGGITATAGGLNVYASPIIDGNNRETLEMVCRYLLRGPIALSRLKQRPDGMLTYRMKKADRRGNTVMVLSPRELLMRLASLIPAPRHPARKYFGILAAGAKLRKLVVPSPTQRRRPACGEGPKTPVQSPVKWADLLKRVWGIDSLACPKCKGRMRAMAVLEDRDAIARLLASLGQTTVFPRAQAPPELAA